MARTASDLPRRVELTSTSRRMSRVHRLQRKYLHGPRLRCEDRARSADGRGPRGVPGQRATLAASSRGLGWDPAPASCQPSAMRADTRSRGQRWPGRDQPWALSQSSQLAARPSSARRGGPSARKPHQMCGTVRRDPVKGSPDDPAGPLTGDASATSDHARRPRRLRRPPALAVPVDGMPSGFIAEASM